MAVKHSFEQGLSFGLTSGIITTLGLIVGLSAGLESKKVVIGGILTIAIADAFSDALGIHIAEESESHHSSREIWEATISTLLSKFIFAATFMIPVLILPLGKAVIASLVWGLLLLGTFSYYIAKKQNASPLKVITEHILIAVIVIVLTHSVGIWIKSVFC